MNKFLLWSGIAILAVTGCVKDQTVEVNKGHEIGFRTAMTKATELEWEDLTAFWCTAVDAKDANYFTDAAFARAGDYFRSTSTYYWPTDGSTIRFWAYYPALDVTGATASISAAEQLIKNFSPQKKFEDQVDFVTATAQGSKADEAGGVHLSFYHQLAQISIYARNMNSEYVYKVYGMRVVNALTEGTYDFSTDSWSFDVDNEKKDTYSTMLATPVELSSDYTELTEDNTAMIIPQNLVAWNPENDAQNQAKGAYLSIAVQITSKGGDRIFPAQGDYGWVAMPVSTSLDDGFDHRYHLDFTSGAGYIDPDPAYGGGETGSALGENVMYTVKVNVWNEPTAGEVKRRQLEGSWLAKKVETDYTFPDNYPGTQYSDRVREDPDEVREFFNGNGFYQFTVDNKYMIHMTTPEGVTVKSKMTVDDAGNIYLEAFQKADGSYDIVPVIQEVDDDNNKAITYILYTNTNTYDGVEYKYTKKDIFYFDKN